MENCFDFVFVSPFGTSPEDTYRWEMYESGQKEKFRQVMRTYGISGHNVSDEAIDGFYEMMQERLGGRFPEALASDGLSWQRASIPIPVMLALMRQMDEEKRDEEKRSSGIHGIKKRHESSYASPKQVEPAELLHVRKHENDNIIII